MIRSDEFAVPLLERLRFLCIVGSNLDEFFEIRVASLRTSLQFGSTATVDGIAPGTLDRKSVV